MQSAQLSVHSSSYLLGKASASSSIALKGHNSLLRNLKLPKLVDSCVQFRSSGASVINCSSSDSTTKSAFSVRVNSGSESENAKQTLLKNESGIRWNIGVGFPNVPAYLTRASKLSLSDQAFFLLAFIACTVKVSNHEYVYFHKNFHLCILLQRYLCLKVSRNSFPSKRTHSTGSSVNPGTCKSFLFGWL